MSGFGFVLITIKKTDGSWLVFLLEISSSCHREVSHGWKLLLSGWPVTCKKGVPSDGHFSAGIAIDHFNGQAED